MFTREEVENALRARARYPIAAHHINRHETNYVDACLQGSPESMLLCLPSGFWEQTNKAVTALRARVLSEYYPTHLAEIGDIWSPVASIQFQFFVLTKDQPELVAFAQFDRVGSLDVPSHFYLASTKLSKRLVG